MEKELVKCALLRQAKDDNSLFHTLMFNKNMRSDFSYSCFVFDRKFYMPEHQLAATVHIGSCNSDDQPIHQVIFTELQNPVGTSLANFEILENGWSTGDTFVERIGFEGTKIIFALDMMNVTLNADYVLEYSQYQKGFFELVFDAGAMKFVNDPNKLIDKLKQTRDIEQQTYIDFRASEYVMDELYRVLFDANSPEEDQTALIHAIYYSVIPNSNHEPALAVVVKSIDDYLNKR